jgi:hypothetical protein
MRKLRALAVALLSVAALTLGSTAAIAADNEPESGGVTAPPTATTMRTSSEASTGDAGSSAPSSQGGWARTGAR